MNILLNSGAIDKTNPWVKCVNPLYSTFKNAYRLSAKRSHRMAMTTFPDGVPDIFERIHVALPCATPLWGSLQLCKSVILPICLKRVLLRNLG